MWKSTVLITILVFFAVSVFAEPFAPALLKLSAPDVIQYDFGGNNLAIPVNVTGTPAEVNFFVFTRNQGSTISRITNGYLGWHYINKIDTCVYMSPSNQMETGLGTINWDGKGEDGAAVPPGEYTFYLFGFDNKSPQVKASEFSLYEYNILWTWMTCVEYDKKGNPLASPLVYRSNGGGTSSTKLIASIISKWVIGNDTNDATLVETTRTMGYKHRGWPAFLPPDDSNSTTFFQDTLKWEGGTKVTRKWTWVPNGDAVLDTNWGSNGEYTYTGAWPAEWNYGPGVTSDGKDRIFLSTADISGAGTESKLIVVNAANGSEVKQLDISQWWVNLNDGKAGGQNCGGPTEIFFRNGLVALGAHGTCVNSVMNPYADTTDDAVLWVNRNGDYIGDHNWEPDSPRKWVCNDYDPGPYKYTTSMDNQGFVIFVSWMGGIEGPSFGLYAPDGTGVAYKNFSASNNPIIAEVFFIDNGSAYDGIYAPLNWNKNGAFQNGIWFVAHDSFKGVITNQTVIDEAAPAAFTVAQNTPNPFNPTTTISFTLTKAGRTTVEVFNMAGQKVETILDTILNSGSHTVTWNAAKYSAGVYFYTVMTGQQTKTMKMTLLK